MARSIDQLYCVAKLIGTCESIAASGNLSELTERRLREHIAEAIVVFNMEPHQDNVRQVMERA